MLKNISLHHENFFGWPAKSDKFSRLWKPGPIRIAKSPKIECDNSDLLGKYYLLGRNCPDGKISGFFGPGIEKGKRYER